MTIVVPHVNDQVARGRDKSVPKIFNEGVLLTGFES